MPTPGASVFVFPPAQTTGGPTVTAEIRVGGAVDLAEYTFKLTWKDAHLGLIDIADGGFLGSTGRTVTCLPAVIGANDVVFSCESAGLSPGPSGNGTLAKLEFATLADGKSDLILGSVVLTDSLLMPQSPTTSDGSITVDSGSAEMTAAWPGRAGGWRR
jgi:hypothetical protein